ncbi:MAG: hypothetical protein JNM90_03775 [Burkholderiales bacterium]|nr:hypothetical protein [Burkholderiales bacterium]
MMLGHACMPFGHPPVVAGHAMRAVHAVPVLRTLALALAPMHVTAVHVTGRLVLGAGRPVLGVALTVLVPGAMRPSRRAGGGKRSGAGRDGEPTQENAFHYRISLFPDIDRIDGDCARSHAFAIMG